MPEDDLLLPPADPTFDAAQNEVADVFGSIAEFWGFTRTQGRIFGLLYTSPQPLSHGEIRRRLEISAGSTSMTLASLAEWGVVRRSERHYAAETDFWKLITGVMRRRERVRVDDAIQRLARVADDLTSAAGDDPRLHFLRERIDHVHGFFRLGRRFLDAFLAKSPLHPLLRTIVQRSRATPPPPSDVRIRA